MIFTPLHALPPSAPFAVRFAYFVVMPFYYVDCSRANAIPPLMFADIFGTLPSFMFLSAFSVLLFTFARIFHTVLRSGQPSHRVAFRVLAVFLICVNVGQYVLLGFQYWRQFANLDDSADSRRAVFLLVGASCVIGLLFSIYSVMLYRNYNILIQNARSEVARAQRTLPSAFVASPLLGGGNGGYGGGYGGSAGDNVQTSPTTTILVNPMRRLAIAACLTAFCFFARAGVLVYLYSNDHQEGVADASYILYVIYFFMAEVRMIARAFLKNKTVVLIPTFNFSNDVCFFLWYRTLPSRARTPARRQTIPEFLLLIAFNTLIGSNSAMATRAEPQTLSGGPILGGAQSPNAPLMGGERSPPGAYVGP